jgi:hypothetical protein
MNPKLNKAFRAYVIKTHGRLYGCIGKETENALIFYNEIESGRIEIIDETTNSGHDTILVSHAEMENYEKNYIPKKNEKTQYHRFAAKGINPNILKEFRNNVWDKHGSTYSYISYEFSKALEMYLKSKNGQIKIIKKSRQYAKRVLNHEIQSPLHQDVLELKKTNEKILKDNKSLKNILQNLVNQILIKPVVKKEKSIHTKAEKAEFVLDSLKKENKTFFTMEDYELHLINTLGYGDNRTVNSYLNLLKIEKQIKLEDRSGLYGSKKYYFTENRLYKKYNGHKAMVKFIQKFKSTFKDHLQISKTELETFISKVTGLKSVKSIEERLDALSLPGYISESKYSPKIFDININ